MNILCSIKLTSSTVFAGSQLTGAVTYTLETPQRVNGIRIKIHGRASWQKEEKKSFIGRPFRFQMLRARQYRFNRGAHNHHNPNDKTKYFLRRRKRNCTIIHGTENFLQKEIYIYGNGIEEILLSAGAHTFSFNYSIPEECPSAFISKKRVSCLVEYDISSERVIQSIPYEDAKEEFYVLKSTDLNSIADASNPVQIEIDKNLYFPCCCCCPKPFTLEATLPKKGFVPGEKIQVNLKCNNQSGFSVKKIRISLCMCLNVFSVKDEHRDIIFRRIITMARKYLNQIGSDELKEFKCLLQTPTIQPWNEFKSDLFEINYFLSYKVKFHFFQEAIRGEIPIILGTIPIVGNEIETTNSTQNYGKKLLFLNDIDDAEEQRFKQVIFQINNPQPVVCIT